MVQITKKDIIIATAIPVYCPSIRLIVIDMFNIILSLIKHGHVFIN